MLAKFEQRSYKDYGRVWIGRYQNLHNLAHWHLEHELIYVEQGSVLVSHNEQEYTLQKGQLIFIHSEDIHYISSSPDGIVQIIMYDGSFLPDMMKTIYLQQPLLLHHYQFSDTFAAIALEQQKKSTFYVEKIHVLLETLLIDIYRKEATKKAKKEDKHMKLPGYKKLLYEIQEHAVDITFAQAADIMGLSDAYFSRYFHKLSGMTFSRYVNTIRIEKAITMLKDKKDMTITEISRQCGFDTIRHFNRVFKDITGMTPKQLPSDFVLYHHTTKLLQNSFDPTLKESILLRD